MRARLTEEVVDFVARLGTRKPCTPSNAQLCSEAIRMMAARTGARTIAGLVASIMVGACSSKPSSPEQADGGFDAGSEEPVAEGGSEEPREDSEEEESTEEESTEEDVDAGPVLPFGEDGGIGQVDEEPAGVCEKSQISIVFNPMHSAFDGEHLYQVPASITGIDADAITWSISDPTIANLSIIPHGVMLTIQKAGTANVVATAGSICGAATLTVAAAETEDWEIGSARYNTGVVVTRIGQGRRGVQTSTSTPVEAACTSCHGTSATTGTFQTVAHTPTQTAGFSDEELIEIITEAKLPEGAYFDESIVSKEMWQSFHRWAMDEEQKKAIVVYLRSLTPSEQTGERAQMGFGADGGFTPPEGGPPPRDAGEVLQDDAGTP